MKLERTGAETIEYFTSEYGTLYARDGSGYWQRYYGYYGKKWEIVDNKQAQELEAAYQE